MKLVKEIVGIGMAALTDIAIGIIIVHLIGRLFGYNIPFYFYPIGIFLALSPDIDYPYHCWQVKHRKRKSYETHRMLPHYPIMIIPVCLVLFALSIFWSIFTYWTIIATLCLTSHYIHDSIEGWIRWLAPIGKRYYGLFNKKDGQRHLVVSYSKKEWKAWVRFRKESANLFEKHYLQLTKESTTGITLFAIAILLILLW